MKNHDMEMKSTPSNTKYIPWAIAVGLVIITGVVYSQYSMTPKTQEKTAMTQESTTNPEATMKKETPVMTKKDEETAVMMKKETPAMMKDESKKEWTKEEMQAMEKEKTEENTAMMKKTTEPDAMIKKEVGYASYTESTMNTALKAGKKVYVFFHATWCPSCQALDADIESHLSMIPSDTLVLKADYDTETSLKQKYGVTIQTTVVKLNNDGSLAKKSLGVANLTALLQ